MPHGIQDHGVKISRAGKVRLWLQVVVQDRPRRATPPLERFGWALFPTFFWRQGTFGADDQGRPGRFLTPFDHWRDVATGLAWATHNCGGELAVTHAGAQAKDAGRNRAGQQDGPTDLGDAYEEWEL